MKSSLSTYFALILWTRMVVIGGEVTAPKPISPAEAGARIGAQVTVVGRIAGVQFSDTTVRLRFGTETPGTTVPFTAVVSHTNAFNRINWDGLSGQYVLITGRVQDVGGHPQMVLHTNAQLQILHKPAPPGPLRISPR